MLKSISKLGSELNVSEKKAISGGCPPICSSNSECPRGYACLITRCEPM